MRKITSKTLLDFLVQRKSSAIGTMPINGPSSKLIVPGNEQKHSENLRRHGFTILDHRLDDALLQAITGHAAEIPCFDNYSDADKPVFVDNPPPNTHVAHYRRRDLVNYDPIMRLANDTAVLRVVQDFLNAKPTISNVNMWWSFGGRKQAQHAQLFHRDFDDWKFCKLFVYLTDVDARSGPHIYVKGSAGSSRLRKIRRYSDAEVEAAFGKENIISLTAPKGTAFLVNTYGFHKGLLPETGNRLLLQVQYSLFPIAIESYSPVKGDLLGFDPYINRLIKTKQ